MHLQEHGLTQGTCVHFIHFYLFLQTEKRKHFDCHSAYNTPKNICVSSYLHCFFGGQWVAKMDDDKLGL